MSSAGVRRCSAMLGTDEQRNVSYVSPRAGMILRRRRRIPGGYVHSRTSEGPNSKVIANGWRRGWQDRVEDGV